MTRLPKNQTEAVGELGVAGGSTVLAVGPDHGYTEAIAGVVGEGGRVVVQAPPPDLETTDGVEVVEDIPDDLVVDAVIGWVGVVPLHGVRDIARHVSEDGSLWLVLPKVERGSRASVTEGELTRAMLSAGWKATRNVGLSTEAFAVLYSKRR